MAIAAVTLYRNNIAILSGDPSQNGTTGVGTPGTSNVPLVQRPVYGAKDSVSYAAGGQQTFSMTSLQTSASVTFPSGVTTATYLRIEGNASASFKFSLNGGTAVAVSPTGSGNGIVEVNGGAITSLAITNLTFAAATFDVIICGN